MKYVIITGASRGLGFRIAEVFASSSHPLLLAARNYDNLIEARDRLKSIKTASDIRIFPADLSERDNINALLGYIDKENIEIDCLINNAGIYAYKPFDETSQDEIIATINLNLTAVILLTHGIIPRMLNNGGGKIINISSDVGKSAIKNMSPYVASKFGIMGFSRAIKKEYHGKNLYVSTVCPGIINNNEINEKDIDKGMLSPSKIAQTVYYIYKNSENINFDEVELHPIMQDY